MPVITEAGFELNLKTKLGAHWDKALSIFQNYGASLSWDVTNVFLHACDQSKVDEVLKIMEEHWTRHLQFQHPDIRGQVRGAFGNPTAQTFIRICTETLGLKQV